MSDGPKPEADDGLPLVGADRGNAPLWLGLLAILALGGGLFLGLENRRLAQAQPAVRFAAVSRDGLTAPYRPPPLDLSPPAAATPALPPPPVAAPPSSPSPSPPPSPPAYPPAALLPSRLQAMMGPPAPPAPPPAAASGASAIVYDATAGDAPVVAGAAPAGAGAAAAAVAGRLAGPSFASRGRASRLATVVPRGTLIPAILETALDSTQPGQARALVSQDVRNLAGDRVLIPRGSRLFGDYRADVAAGQKRAFVQWLELVRPDGAVIAIDSPATDPLGRAGVRGRVDTHFPARLGGALLQSAIDFGTLAGAQAVGRNGVILASPAVQNGTSQLVGPLPKPSLSVRQGAQISVLVARDLEFAPVEPAP
ncbi:MAG: TrbI/VirB10 family protein [Sphingomonadales bacterium]|jgi:type IV secretion system protein VirB10